MIRRHSWIVLIFVAFGCVTTPVTHRKQLNFIPESKMDALGLQAYQEVLSKSKLSNDAALTKQVVEIGQRIAKASGVDYKWEFKLIDDPKTVNAFCLPGGKVAVYTGIIPIAKNNAGLAAVLGHEVAHAVLHHGAERMSQAMAVQAGLALASLTFEDSKYRNLIAGALGIGAQFGVMLPFSRQHESEANNVGLRYMAKAGYDPKEAVELWQRMGKEGAKIPEFLSTHPNPERRAEDLKAEMGDVMPVYDASAKQPTAPLK